MIDVHTHIGYYHNSRKNAHIPPLTAEGLLRMMDERGIERACVLPLISPETTALQTSNIEIVEECARFPDRLVPFANVDPRSCGNRPDADFSWALAYFKDRGCKGVGEVTANLPLDDPLVMNFLEQCGEAGLPVTIHVADSLGGKYGLADELHLPRLERVLKALPRTVIIGHAAAFWAEITADVKEEDRGGYPSGPVRAPGRVQELLEKYPNMYADLSAKSGFNALNRDRGHARTFLETYRDKLLFGTDYLREGFETPIISFLKEIGISRETYEAVTRGNAVRLLGL